MLFLARNAFDSVDTSASTLSNTTPWVGKTPCEEYCVDYQIFFFAWKTYRKGDFYDILLNLRSS